MALAILGLVLVAVMAGMMTTLRASATNNRGVTAKTVLVSAAERMKHEGYWPCGDVPPDYAVELARVRSRVEPRGNRPFELGLASLRFWNEETGEFQATCPTDGDAGVQLLTLEVTLGSATVRGDVVVRDPEAMPR